MDTPMGAGQTSEKAMAYSGGVPEPVDADLTKELASRADYHGAEASWLEEAARRHRAAERACRSGVESLEMAQMDSAPQVRY